ncbi:endo alpha-1,4 polygalactosaminidase [Benzoatithermus flavus]|uniref:Endo alpha-1,4 polygalactosaminidase n=1 Tax=Benzoatithermus flavus TaxID=3108223 RepID=A0ABU8XRR0_9PROT
MFPRAAPSPTRSAAALRRRRRHGRVIARRHGLAAMLAAVLAASTASADGPWRPAQGQRLDLQILPPLDLARPVDVLALDPFATSPDQVRRLSVKGIATVCHLAAGVWESWRPDAFAFPQGVLGRNVPGRPGTRRLEVGDPAVLPLLERRLDLCRERGFAGVLLAGFESGPAAPALPGFVGALAAAARARGLAVGAFGEPASIQGLAGVLDFAVAADCLAAMPGCVAAARTFRAAGKPVWLVAYTNATARMTALCAEAAGAGATVLFKTATLTGRLHRRCG